MAGIYKSPAIGIDLGTTYSCFGVWKDHRVEIIPNDLGSRATPSCVAFTDLERLAGDSAKNQCYRAFMESHLPAFKKKSPRLDVETEMICGQHPHLKAFYKNKNERVVCVKNLSPEDVLLQATRLRNALGRKVVKLKKRHVTKHPSVQGTWTTDLKL